MRKDSDLRHVVVMAPATRRLFLDAASADASFLRELGLMDYSLLLGLHWGIEGGSVSPLELQARIRAESEEVAAAASALTAAAAAAAAAPQASDSAASPTATGAGTGVGGVRRPEGPRLARLRRQNRSEASIAAEASLPRAYFFGVIDFLTAYTASKRCEHLLKVYGRCLDGRGISAVRPSLYRHRFVAAMQLITRDATREEMAAGVVPKPFGLEPASMLLSPAAAAAAAQAAAQAGAGADAGKGAGAGAAAGSSSGGSALSKGR